MVYVKITPRHIKVSSEESFYPITWQVLTTKPQQGVRLATQYAPIPCKLTISSHLFTRWRCCSGITISFYLFARWHLFRHVGYLRHQQQVDLWPFDIESGVRVTCDVGYLCAKFSLPKPLCSRVRPDVRDRQMSDRQDVRQKHCLMPPPYGGRRHNN